MKIESGEALGDDPLAEMADILMCRITPKGCFSMSKLGHVNKGPAVKGRISYTFYMTHGVGGGRTKGSKANVAARPNEVDSGRHIHYRPHPFCHHLQG